MLLALNPQVSDASKQSADFDISLRWSLPGFELQAIFIPLCKPSDCFVLRSCKVMSIVARDCTTTLNSSYSFALKQALIFFAFRPTRIKHWFPRAISYRLVNTWKQWPMWADSPAYRILHDHASYLSVFHTFIELSCTSACRKCCCDQIIGCFE